MNTFTKFLDKEKMFYYVSDNVFHNALESVLIILTIVFIVWSVKLVLEKE